MRTVTEFMGLQLRTLAKTHDELQKGGKSPEEISTALGEASKAEGDKLKLLLGALNVTKGKLDKVKRVIVVALNEGEKAPSGAMQPRKEKPAKVAAPAPKTEETPAEAAAPAEGAVPAEGEAAAPVEAPVEAAPAETPAAEPAAEEKDPHYYIVEFIPEAFSKQQQSRGRDDDHRGGRRGDKRGGKGGKGGRGGDRDRGGPGRGGERSAGGPGGPGGDRPRGPRGPRGPQGPAQGQGEAKRLGPPKPIAPKNDAPTQG